MTLGQAVKFKKLTDALGAREVEPQWAGCFSWTDILNNPYGFFYLVIRQDRAKSETQPGSPIITTTR